MVRAGAAGDPVGRWGEGRGGKIFLTGILDDFQRFVDEIRRFETEVWAGGDGGDGSAGERQPRPHHRRQRCPSILAQCPSHLCCIGSSLVLTRLWDHYRCARCVVSVALDPAAAATHTGAGGQAQGRRGDRLTRRPSRQYARPSFFASGRCFLC